MTFLVRQLSPRENGLPIEIYVFCKETNWNIYESVQADIFDHILAVVPEFDLKVFQEPSGSDITGDYEKAIEEFSRNGSPLANFNLGNSMAFAGRLKDALDAYDKVLVENPQHEDAKFNRDLIEKLLREQKKQ